MRSLLAAVFFLSMVAASQPTIQSSFETNYMLLQKKVEALKEKGEKVTDQSRKEIEALMVQMNHEHAELKRELERKNQVVTQKVSETVKAEKDWSGRIAGAYHEISGGMVRAWEKLKVGSN